MRTCAATIRCVVSVVALLLHCAGPQCLAGPPPLVPYGTKVKFKQDVRLSFPDFSLTYIGKRHVKSPTYPRGFVYRDFIVFDRSIHVVSWSSGTGDIAPLEFPVGNKVYSVELATSDKLGHLTADEIVVNRK